MKKPDPFVGLDTGEAKFVMELATGATQSAAFIAAYPAKKHKLTYSQQKGHQIARKPKIKLALEAYQQQLNSDTAITRDTLIAQLLEHREIAVRDKQLGAANSAVMNIAKLMGLDVQRIEVNHNHQLETEQATQELFELLGGSKAIDVTPVKDRATHAPTELIAQDAAGGGGGGKSRAGKVVANHSPTKTPLQSEVTDVTPLGDTDVTPLGDTDVTPDLVEEILPSLGSFGKDKI